MNKVFYVANMHCASCKVLLESEISRISGVKSVKVDIKSGEIFVSGEFVSNEINKTILDLGYDLGKSDNNYISRNPKTYLSNIISLFLVGLVFAAFIFLEKIGLGINYSNSEMTLLVALFLGIAAGLSTCMAITGSIVLAITTRYKEQNPMISGRDLAGSQVVFNLGRIVGFGIFGAILGLVGQSLTISPKINSLLIFAISLYMLFVAIQLSEIFPKISKIHFNLLGKLRISQYLSTSNAGPFLAGILTFFLPCGFTQLAQVAAIGSGSSLKGALIMSVFAIGTAPGLVFIGAAASMVRGRWLKHFYRLVAMILLVAALFNIYSVASIDVIGGKNEGSSVELSKKYQEVKITANVRGYTPNRISVKSGVPIRLVINSESQYTCANYFVIPSLKINQVLAKGENIVEIPAQKVGVIDFACSMGMYNGQFVVQ